jgi:hypothetical protein
MFVQRHWNAMCIANQSCSFASKELFAIFNVRSLAQIDADIDACSSEDRLDDLTTYIEERAKAEDHLAEVELMVSKLGLAT